MRPLPPLVFLLCLLVMSGLRLCLPGPLFIPWPWALTGLAPLALGLMLTLGGAGQFRRRDTNIKTFDDPDVLVTDGWFRLSRNPMYLGFVLALLGVATLLGAVVPFAVVLLFWVLTDRWYIAFEERAMRRRFGDAYEAYARRVRRWL